LQTVEEAPDEASATYEIALWTKDNEAITNVVLEKISRDPDNVSSKWLNYMQSLFKVVPVNIGSY
jgi:hypothetical protein